MEKRIAKINRCMYEIWLAQRDQVAGNLGALQSEMDWLDELHYWLYNAA